MSQASQHRRFAVFSVSHQTAAFRRGWLEPIQSELNGCLRMAALRSAALRSGGLGASPCRTLVTPLSWGALLCLLTFVGGYPVETMGAIGEPTGLLEGPAGTSYHENSPEVTVAAEQQDDESDELLSLVLEWLSGDDAELRTLALEQVRTDVPGSEATQKFAALLTSVAPETRSALILALADRGDRSARDSISKMLNDPQDPSTLLAAINALGRLGQSDDVEALIGYLAAGNEELRAAAANSLRVLQGEGVLERFSTEIRTASEPTTQQTLIEIAVERRAAELLPVFLELKLCDNFAVRSSALQALGQLGQPEHVVDMTTAVIRAKEGRERDEAEKAILTLYNRFPTLADDPQHPLLMTFMGLSGNDQAALLSTVGRVGGAPARKVLDWYLNHPYPFVKDVGWKALCHWPNAEIAPELVAALDNPRDARRRSLAFKALVRVAGLPTPDGNEAQRLEWLTTALDMATNEQEKILVLKRLPAIRTVDALRVAIPLVNQEGLSESACQAVVELSHLRWLRDEHRDEFMAALDKVLATTTDPVLQDRAQRYKEGKTWTGS
jgi:HEAT repeat protein